MLLLFTVNIGKTVRIGHLRKSSLLTLLLTPVRLGVTWGCAHHFRKVICLNNLMLSICKGAVVLSAFEFWAVHSHTFQETSSRRDDTWLEKTPWSALKEEKRRKYEQSHTKTLRYKTKRSRGRGNMFLDFHLESTICHWQQQQQQTTRHSRM